MSPRSLPACAAIQSDRHLIATGRYGALSPTSHIRPSAAAGHPIRIAVIQAWRYASGLYAISLASPRKAVGCCSPPCYSVFRV